MTPITREQAREHESVLTDEDYVALSRGFAVNKYQARAIEQAILNKQAEKAQPVAWVWRSREPEWYPTKWHAGAEPPVSLVSRALEIGWEPLYAHPPTPSALLEAAEKAADCMDRARNVLTQGSPRPECNWGMLDTADFRAAIEAQKKGQA